MDNRDYKAMNEELNQPCCLGAVMRCASLKDEAYKVLTNSKDDWEITRHKARHKPTGITYWIANGLPFFHNEAHDSDVSIGLWNWLKLWKWIKNVQRIKVIESLKHSA
jgi:hypothetical protein